MVAGCVVVPVTVTPVSVPVTMALSSTVNEALAWMSPPRWRSLRTTLGADGANVPASAAHRSPPMLALLDQPEME